MQTETWIAIWITTTPSGHIRAGMMEGQTPYSMFKRVWKLIPKEVRTKVA